MAWLGTCSSRGQVRCEISGTSSHLVWTPSVPDDKNLNPLVLNGKNWLISKGPVSDFVRDVQRTNQFAVRVVCILREVGEGDKRIVSISDSSGVTNLTLRQEDTNLSISGFAIRCR